MSTHQPSETLNFPKNAEALFLNLSEQQTRMGHLRERTDLPIGVPEDLAVLAKKQEEFWSMLSDYLGNLATEGMTPEKVRDIQQSVQDFAPIVLAEEETATGVQRVLEEPGANQ